MKLILYQVFTARQCTAVENPGKVDCDMLTAEVTINYALSKQRQDIQNLTKQFIANNNHN